MKNLFVLFTLLFVFQSSASAAAEEDYSTPEKTLAAVVQFVKKSIVTIDHDVFVYHYRPRQPSDSMGELREKAAAIYTSHVRRTVYGPSAGSFPGMMGDGLYAALDPVASRVYGKANWVLFQIRLAKGSLYWDTSAEKQMPPGLDIAIRTYFGCDAYGSTEIVRSEDCFDLRQRVLRRINVVGIGYSWSRGLDPRICESRNLALFLTNLVPFKKDDIEVFSQSWIPFGDRLTSNRRALQLMVHFSQAQPLWPLLNPIAEFREDAALNWVKKWAKQNLLKCEPEITAAP